VTLLLLTIAPKGSQAASKLADALECVAAEDATLEVSPGEIEGEVVIGAASERQLEHVLDRLRREFKVDASVGRPRVAYVEVVTRAADGEMKYRDRGEYAHVKVCVSPGPAPGGHVIDSHIIGGAIPERFTIPVEDGIRERLSRGIIGGYPVRSVRVELVDGSYHDADSTAAAFRIAASRAVREALFMAGCVVLEPLMRVESSVPVDSAEAVARELIRRRGRIASLETRAGTQQIHAIAPLADLFGFESCLRESTHGRGSCAIDFDSYAPMQPADGNDEDRDSRVTAPRRPASPLRHSSIALPEPGPETTDK
jgi:elongation factor G